ncbi:ExbD/TolR family protein [Desulfonatronum sp. SC1]|uniref:ExbD/TolR family protein n=1 Tax=Desulfonatronum sp. SC1 TaxID=2109626 RepID=UPI000D2F89AB|nr:ExbD/TolR family protein [Desulfonatronum sp. SC1]PTN33174.1 protein TolR [Desulfonatronum sp. SC1]
MEGHTGQGYMDQMNVVPFVDVMLVLLVIFMVTAPFMTEGLEVDLPQTRTVQTLPQDEDTLVLTIRSDGSIFLDQYEVALGELGEHVERLIQTRDRILYLRADKDVPYGLVVQVMAEAREAGVERLGIVAESEPREP